MKIPAIFSSLFVLFACAAAIADVENGIYELTQEHGSPNATRTIGGKIHLGKKLTSDFGKAQIWSVSNRNDHFRVHLKQVANFDTDGQFAIWIDGVCEVVSSHTDSTKGQPIDLIVDMRGLENAEMCAHQFGVQVELRKHPGHQLSVSFEPEKDSYKIGEPVVIELQIENVGQNTVRFKEGGQQRGARDNQFGFIASPALPDSGDPMNRGGKGALRTLEPGDVFHKEVDITKWFKFEKPLHYEITGLYELEFQNEHFDVKHLWDEIVVGRCRVHIQE